MFGGNWRAYFGITPECEDAQPGHTKGVWLFYAAIAVCGLAAWYGASHT